MIPYHGTPVGGSRQETARFLAGRHALVPYPRPDDLPTVAEVCQSFAFDNGAFSVWKRGEVLDVDGYTDWCGQWYRHPGFDWALIPDVIDGTERENNELIGSWPRHITGVPVWHLHESLDRLCWLAAGWPRVALGSSGQWPNPGTDSWWGRMGEVLEAVCDEGRPRCKLHGLRMLSVDVFTRLPLASADSTNATQNSGSTARFGMYCPPRSGTRAAVIAERIEAYQSAPVWVPEKEQPCWWNIG